MSTFTKFVDYDLNEQLGRIEADMRVEAECKIVDEVNQINRDIERFMKECPLEGKDKSYYANKHVVGKFHEKALLVLADIYEVEYIKDEGIIEGNNFVYIGPNLDKEIFNVEKQINELRKRKKSLESLKRHKRTREEADYMSYDKSSKSRKGTN